MASNTSGMNSDGWSLNEWGQSKTSGKQIPDWPDDATNAAFDFNDRDQSMVKQEQGCTNSGDCGSGFACIGKYCVKVDGRTATGGGRTNVSPGSNCEITPDPDLPPVPRPDPCGGVGSPAGGGSTGGCTRPGCGQGQDDITRPPGPNRPPPDCCGGPTYTRCGVGGCSGPQCEPFDPPRGCSLYCTDYWESNGEYGEGCGEGNTCSECSYCYQTQGGAQIVRECRPKSGNSQPCYCYGFRGCEGDCVRCQLDPEKEDFGRCDKECEGCVTWCNCFVTCNCGIELKGTWTQPACASGPVCPNNCRNNLLAECEKRCPPPPKDPCKSDPNDPCKKDCGCVTIYRECSESLGPPPEGCSWTQLGFISTCGFPPENFPEGSPGPQKAYIMRKCCGKPDPGCKCRNAEGDQVRPCGPCEECTEEGFCQKDEDLCKPCSSNTVCGSEGNEQCCSGNADSNPGGGCAQECSWTVVDACHGAGFSFSGPCDSASLGPPSPVTKEQAVCNRYHTHCAVLTCGRAVGTHLDCQAGLTSNGPTGSTTCPC